MEIIDKLTLELLMNKNTYSRYIEKTDPNKHKEEQEFRKKIHKYKSRMLSLTMKYLDDQHFQINHEMNEMFYNYSKTMVKYFEMNDLEVSCFYSNEKVDDDTIFENIDNDTTITNVDCDDDNFENIESASIIADDGSCFSEKVDKSQCRYTMDRYVIKK